MDPKLTVRISKIQSEINNRKAEKISAEKEIEDIKCELKLLNVNPEDLDNVISKERKELEKLEKELLDKLLEAEKILGIKG